MNRSLICIFASLLTFTSMSFAEKPQNAQPEPKYQSQAPLPKGWPTPGPYYQVVQKSYPASRAAFTDGSSGFAFMRLFRHIKREEIPMTTPVEMKLEGDGKPKLTQMAFLYQDQDVGEIGADGRKIEVKDVPACKVLTYAWMGERSKENIAKAKAAIMKELASKKLQYSSMRVFGYNGPSIPDEKKTFELQAVLK